MRFLVNYGKVFTLLLILFPLLSISASYIYFQYQDTKKEIVQIVQTSMLDKKHELLDIYIDYLEDEFGDQFITKLKTNAPDRERAENSLRLMQNSEVQYIYLLYIDKKDRLRYLLDTTKEIDERGEYKQRFFPQKDIWKKAQIEQKTEVAAQKDIDKLWITMVYPIVVEGKTVALVGIDFSHQEYVQVSKTLIPLERIYFYSALIIFVMLLSALVQLVIYYQHRKKSFIDPLTGMFNRQYLNELLAKYPVSAFHILLMDLDHFKQVNDIYGHDAGDIVLSTVASRIRSVVRKQDILIRYGGEEFILLIPAKSLDISLQLAQRIRLTIRAEPIKLPDYSLAVTISMGLNHLPGESKDFEGAVKIADEGLYKAKKLGRDRVEIYDAKMTSGDNGLEKMCDIKDALDNDRIFCLHQPIFNIQNMQIDKYELLIRMRDEQGKVIAPDKFLPSVLNTQVYVHLTQKVIEFADEALRNSDCHISINLNVTDLFNDEIIELIEKVFGEDKSTASRLTLEVLETEEISEFDRIIERLKHVQDLGIKIAINNFGRGYTNYRFFLALKIDYLKLDASLIRDIDKNTQAQTLLQSLQHMSTNMNIRTVAEHIESQKELEIIKELGIDYAQGYYLAEPSEIQKL